MVFCRNEERTTGGTKASINSQQQISHFTYSRSFERSIPVATEPSFLVRTVPEYEHSFQALLYLITSFRDK